jgi:outer membrane protein W
MKKIFIYTLVLLAVVTGSQRAGAQDLPYYTPNPATFQIRYGMGLPMDGLKQQVSGNSFNGWDASLMFHLDHHFSLGLAVEYQDFYQKYPRDVYYYGDQNTNISAVVSNSIQNIPILLKGTYSFLQPTAVIQPYIGVGVGINAVTYRQYLGEFTNYNQSSGKLALNGEVGVKIPVSRNHRFGIDLAAEYNYLPYNQFGINNMDYIGIKGGIYLPL